MDGDIIHMALGEDITIITMVDIADFSISCLNLSMSHRLVAYRLGWNLGAFVLVSFGFFFFFSLENISVACTVFGHSFSYSLVKINRKEKNRFAPSNFPVGLSSMK
ncbi:hypothetical protein BT93_F0068 [Corymbia citriodora subsp. variegata]|nr:hypothetical protein BT93_F0068 [Corymbia citriodora subsp. variegata]